MLSLGYNQVILLLLRPEQWSLKMVDYFDTTQMSSALSNLTAKLTGKAGEVNFVFLQTCISQNNTGEPLPDA